MSGKAICMLKGAACFLTWFPLISFYIIPMCCGPDPWFVFGNMSSAFTEMSDLIICSPVTLYSVFRSGSVIIVYKLIAVRFYDLM